MSEAFRKVTLTCAMDARWPEMAVTSDQVGHGQPAVLE